VSLPKIVSQEEKTAARRALLEKETDLTRQRDRLNTERRQLPMVEVTKPYEFEGPDGTVSLLDLFGRPQLMLYHFTFHPDWQDGCPSSPGQARAVDGEEGLDDPAVLTNDGDFIYDFGARVDASRGYHDSTTAPSTE
jgi:predicted dithiol-disulfide oxidoreductase (DUF899 family)